jgi:hypothetical protein
MNEVKSNRNPIRTRAPAIPSFLPILTTPLPMALAIGGSTLARKRYHPSVSSSSGTRSIASPSALLPPSDQIIFETQSIIGNEAGVSRAVTLRSAGRFPWFNSRSYLILL